MDWIAFPKGFVLGLSIAAPVGPIGLLTIRRTLVDGYRIGLVTGLGAATADATYGLIAAFGLTAVMATLIDHTRLIRLIGGLALIYLGTRGIFHARRVASSAATVAIDPRRPWPTYAQAVGLTLTNPTTILSFIAMFAGIGIVKPGANLASSLALVIGVGMGSAAWWFFLCGLTARVRTRLSARAVSTINFASSGSILVFGLVALWAAH
jgi:threonine/homoserine/homoserine lactone efflux protein